MNRTAARSTLLLLSILLAAAPASALDLGGHDRDGVVVGLGLGIGWNKYEFSLPERGPVDTGYQDSFAPMLSVGWARSDYFIASLSLTGWSKSFYQSLTPISAKSLVFMADVAWFPRGEGFWLKGTLGLGDLDLSATTATEFLSVKDTGMLYGFGAGYEFRVSGQAAFGLSYDARFLTLDAMDQFGEVKTINQSGMLFFRFYQ
jgi:hypothetical protein